MSEPLFLPLSSEERERQERIHSAAGTLSPEAVRRALDELWDKRVASPDAFFPYERAPWGVTPWQEPPQREVRIVIAADALDRALAAEADRLAWIDGVKRRLGLVTMAGEP